MTKTPAFYAGNTILEYEFTGRHLIASYFGCDSEALTNKAKLTEAMKSAVKASGALLLNFVEHEFAEGGVTLVMLLAESHSSIHTYPEHGACFVDLFTCGHTCNAEKFDMVMRNYLKPEKVDRQILIRD